MTCSTSRLGGIYLQRKHRLRNRRDFRRVFKYGRSTANRHFVVYVLRKKEDKPVRIGISISKRVAKHAVDRNRMKRLMKEIVRGWLGRLAAGQDLVIIARRASVGMNYTQVEKNLRHLFGKAHLLSRKNSIE